MKILYRQPENGVTAFDDLGIKELCFKQLSIDKDSKKISAKAHHHSGFEIHIIESGHQIYEVAGEQYKLEKGDFLLIPPELEHRVAESASATMKYSVTFNAIPKSPATSIHKLFCGKCSERVTDRALLILSEHENRLATSKLLISGAVFEIAITILRLCKISEKQAHDTGDDSEFQLNIAKQYIRDNSEHAVKVSEVAEYCHISVRHLTRIFATESITPAEYIRDQRVKKVADFLKEGKLSLKEISDKMDFSSEYYFNSFFKKHSGMTPGEYRKMNSSD